MTRRSVFEVAAGQLARAGSAGASLCTPFVAAFGVAGASVSTMTRPFEIENVCASDAASARVAQTQLDLGQGPSWSALAARAPVASTDVAERSRRWPALVDALETGGESVGAIYALPLSVGSLDIGALGLYCATPTRISDADLIDAAQLAKIVSTQVLHRALDGIDDDVEIGPAPTWSSRREMHQATGMIVARFRVDPADALVILRAHAFALGRPVLEVAEGVVDRSIEIGWEADEEK